MRIGIQIGRLDKGRRNMDKGKKDKKKRNRGFCALSVWGILLIRRLRCSGANISSMKSVSIFGYLRMVAISVLFVNNLFSKMIKPMIQQIKVNFD